MTRLPAAGRLGEPPSWPLGRANKAERDLWTRLWKMPQAVIWERFGWIEVVACYAQIFVRAVGPEPSHDDLVERRQLEDRLGLNPMSMMRLRWEVVDEETGEELGPDTIDIRERLRASGE